MSESNFGELLRHHRRASRLTQEELAERSGLSCKAIGLLERGRTLAPQRFTLHALNTALGLTGEAGEAFAEAARRSACVDDAPCDSRVLCDVSARGDLPIPLTPLIGRACEVETLLALLAQPTTRLLTLTGPAGAGKTRLALHVAAALRDSAHHDVAFIGLVPVREAERVLGRVAQALGIREDGATSPRDALVDTLRDRQCLLVLDNFEQVAPAARSLLEVLVACPNVQALVTSRTALNVRGERCFPVAPLSMPDAAQLASLEELSRVPAVALFLDRVTAHQPAFALETLEAGRLVAEICVRLDGLPLAIELAAALVRPLGLRQLHERLSQPTLLGMLSGGPQDLAEHQRTMRSTIEWSYRLLGAQEQRLFRWLGVFVGGASFEALGCDAAMSDEQFAAALAALVDANLIRSSDDGVAKRYTQLVTLQAYAQAELEVSGEWAEARRRHAEHFLWVVEGLLDLRPGQLELARARVEEDYENIRAALAWALETDATMHGLRMAGAMWRFWFANSPFLEGLSWLERFIAAAGEPATREEQCALAEAWTGVMAICHRLDQFERAKEAGETALALRRAEGDEIKVAYALHDLANPVAALREFDHAHALYEEGLRRHRAAKNHRGVILCLFNLGDLAYARGQPCEALAYYEESLALSREVGETDLERALTWNGVGEASIMLDKPHRAIEVTEQSHRVFLREHDTFGIATTAWTLGRAHWRLGDGQQAGTYLAEAEQLFSTIGNRVLAARVLCVRAGVAIDGGDFASAQRDLAQAYDNLTSHPRSRDLPWWLIERIAASACHRGQYEVAARLFGAALQHWEAAPVPVDPAERDQRERTRARLESVLGEQTLTCHVAAGRTLAQCDLAELVRQALVATAITL